MHMHCDLISEMAMFIRSFIVANYDVDFLTHPE